MLLLIQLILILVLLACWVAAIVAYYQSTRHKRPDARYVDPWTSEGLTARGAELRRLYWQIVLAAVVLGAFLVLTIIVAPRS